MRRIRRPIDSASARNEHTINSRGASGIGIASLLAAVSGLVILFVAAHALTIEENSHFLVFWGVLFGIYGILGGVQIECTRAVRAAELDSKKVSTSGGAQVLHGGIAVGVAFAIIIIVLGLLFGKYVFPNYSFVIVLTLAGAAIVYSGHASLAGALQGQRRWRSYAGLMSGEALIRLAAVTLAAVLGAPLLGLELATLAAVLVWLMWLLVSKSARTATKGRADVAMPVFLKQIGHALVSAGSSAALIVSYPLLVRLTATDEQYASAAPLLLAISLTRAPIMLPMQAFQGVAIAQMMKPGSGGATALRKPLFLITAVGFVGAIAAWLIGPALMTIFGPGYKVEGWVLAALTLSAALMSVLMLLGTAVLALGRHRAYSVGWLASTSVAIALLLVPVGLDVKCLLSLSLGPLAGTIIFLSTLNGSVFQSRCR